MHDLDATSSDENFYYIFSMRTGIIKQKIPIWRCEKCNATNTTDHDKCHYCGTLKPKLELE